MKKRIVFMGTPNIAKAMLVTLVEANYNVVGVVTQPDKKVGRKQILQMSEVKEYAISQQIEVFQPIKIKDDYTKIQEWQPDLIVTCAYGQFIPDDVLQLPTYGSINLHASLLPKLRGGAPIHWAVIQGEKVTGMSIMRMTKKMDAGAVMVQKEVVIEDNDTMGDVYEKLKICGSKLLLDALPSILDGSAIFYEQDHEQATFGLNITKEQEKIDFNQSLDQIYNKVRGLIPFPVGYTIMQGKKVKIHKAHKVQEKHSFENGTLCGFLYDGYAIAVDGGYLVIDELQIEGKQKVSAQAFSNAQGKVWLHTKVE